MNRESKRLRDGAGWQLLMKLTGSRQSVSDIPPVAQTPIVDTHAANDDSANEESARGAARDDAASVAKFERFISVIQSSPIVPNLPMDDADIRRIVEEFVDHLRADITELQILASAADFETIASIGHRLKGSAGTLGFPDFHKPATNLEIAARQRDAADVAVYVRALAGLVDRILIPPVPTR